MSQPSVEDVVDTALDALPQPDLLKIEIPLGPLAGAFLIWSVGRYFMKKLEAKARYLELELNADVAKAAHAKATFDDPRLQAEFEEIKKKMPKG